MTVSSGKKILISGASFAGLSSAYWMNQLGYDVTVVEVGPRIRTGGTAVNIRGNTIGIVKRMGLFDKIRPQSPELAAMGLQECGRPGRTQTRGPSGG